jgi:hypothetical protein
MQKQPVFVHDDDGHLETLVAYIPDCGSRLLISRARTAAHVASTVKENDIETNNGNDRSHACRNAQIRIRQQVDISSVDVYLLCPYRVHNSATSGER